MGLGRDNRARQRLGKLLDLTRKQQDQRLEWQKSRPLDWTDTMILEPREKAVMSWGFAAIFDLEEHRYIKFEKAGKKRLDIATPRWYTTIKMDTTERIARNAIANKKRARY